MGPEEIERVVGAITEKDVMSFAQRKLWDQDVAVSAIGSIEGLLDYNRYVFSEVFHPGSKCQNTDIMCNRIRNDMSRNA
jgi:hypothetical protein